MYQGAQTGVVCVLPLLIALRPKLRELQCVLIAATGNKLSLISDCEYNILHCVDQLAHNTPA